MHIYQIIFFTIIEYENESRYLHWRTIFRQAIIGSLEHSWPRVFRANLTTWGACGRTSRRALIPVRISTLEITGFGTEIKRELFSLLFSRLLSFSFGIFGFKNPANSWFFLSGIFGFSLKNNVSFVDEWSWLFISKGWPAINQGRKSKGLSEKRKVSRENEKLRKKRKVFANDERFHEKRKVSRENREVSLLV